MNAAKLNEIEARANAATADQSNSHTHTVHGVMAFLSEHDWEFYYYAREDVLGLIREVRELQDQLKHSRHVHYLTGREHQVDSSL